jgi:hypothetical protein
MEPRAMLRIPRRRSSNVSSNRVDRSGITDGRRPLRARRRYLLSVNRQASDRLNLSRPRSKRANHTAVASERLCRSITSGGSHTMKLSPILLESEEGISAYTHLFACLIEEDGGFAVQVRLSNSVKEENAAWGEEVTDCFETACMLVGVLAAEFSILTEHIKIELRMGDWREGTLH